MGGKKVTLGSKLSAAEEQVRQLRTDLEGWNARIDTLQADVEEKDGQIEDLESRLKTTEETRDGVIHDGEETSRELERVRIIATMAIDNLAAVVKEALQGRA